MRSKRTGKGRESYLRKRKGKEPMEEEKEENRRKGEEREIKESRQEKEKRGG